MKTHDRHMKFRMYFQKLFQPIMDVDFISKDGVACHNTKDYVVFLKFFIYCTFWSFGNVCQILGLWRGASVCMYLEAVASILLLCCKVANTMKFFAQRYYTFDNPLCYLASIYIHT